MSLPALPSHFTNLGPTRSSLHLLATHVLARARFEVTGRFGLLPDADGGFKTPEFDGRVLVLRLDGHGAALYDSANGSTLVPSTLAAAAEWAGVDMTATFSAGTDTPAVGDSEQPLELHGHACGLLGAWFALSATVLGPLASAQQDSSGVQLWPEHFDAAFDTAFGAESGQRANVGMSPGDSSSAEPYAYVGPWTPDRPGSDGYWNASFGARLPYSAVLRSATKEHDAVAVVASFLTEGLTRLAGTSA